MPRGVYIRTKEHNRINSESKRGKKKGSQSAEHRRNLSKALTGKKHSPETKRKQSKSHVGKKHTLETIEKQRAHIGDKNSNWRGGKSFEEYPREFNGAKQQIRERDDHVCQLCGKTEEENGRLLDVHHIDYNKQNCANDNLIALCRSCNVKANGNALKEHIYMRVFQQKLAGDRYE